MNKVCEQVVLLLLSANLVAHAMHFGSLTFNILQLKNELMVQMLCWTQWPNSIPQDAETLWCTYELNKYTKFSLINT